jgi:2-polyprenyl-3-methyl-5-hydroxy-6-metoxy-1,4-benzoquinol methylase
MDAQRRKHAAHSIDPEMRSSGAAGGRGPLKQDNRKKDTMPQAAMRNMPQVATWNAAEKSPEVEYILGHSPAEIRRLMLQAALLKPITERLLREAGLAPGMRVLDLGCGTGDVAMLAAEIVGPEGEVVGIDRSADVLAVAQGRALGAGHTNIEFREGAAESFADRWPFDLAVGRYVLIHQADPAEFIHAAALHVRRGGAVAFHEIGLYGECQALPAIPLLQQVWDVLMAAFHSVMAHPDAGGRMVAHFRDAGLPRPTMFCEVPVGTGPESPVLTILALATSVLLPQIEKIGASTAAALDVDTLEDRLRDAMANSHSQVLFPMQFCGWARV